MSSFFSAVIEETAAWEERCRESRRLARRRREERDAAHLEAAAPAMYEALEKAVRVMNTFGNITNWPEEMPQEYAEAINEGRTALAAARGES